MKKIKTESKQTDNESKSSRQKSEYEKISNRMSVQKSTTTNELFASDNDQWEKYHSYRDFSFQGYPQDDIPVNKIINHLNEKSKYKLKILDLGCGRNLIKDKFKSNPKFNIIGYDHISYNGSIAVDISKLPDEDESIDICIFSQSLMGSNWREYLIDAQRVLKYNGEMIISESIDRIDDIKAVLNEIGMTIIMENRVQNGDMFGRWFYIYAIRR
jgi:ribosomal RNA-processing protein 8